MRILVVNKFWYRRGGLERVMFDEIAWLEATGHVTAHFSTMHPDNVESPSSQYFVPYLELGEADSLPVGDRARAALRMFSNPEAARRFDRLLGDFGPDVVHVHGIHRQISPSVLTVARRRGVPVVQTLHDYHHLCPANVLLRPDASTCEPRLCGTRSYVAAVRHRCVRHSLAASTLSAAETSFQRIRGVYERSVDRFVSPSRFLARLMAAGGWGVPITVVPNAVQVGASQRPRETSGFLYAGRLSPEKGVDVLLAAAHKAGVRVTVAGGGPLTDELASRFPRACFVGHLSQDALAEVMRTARAAVVPSICFENAPMSVLEPMAAAVPVIASRIGGIPELVGDGTEGLLVAPGDHDALATALRRLQADPDAAARLGAAGRARALAEFTPAMHVARLIEVYEEVVAARRTA